VLVNLKWPEAEKDADPDQTPTLRTLQLRDRAPSTPAAFAKAGVKFAFYSGDTANPKDLLKAVKKSVDAGLASDAALRALTLAPAELLASATVSARSKRGKSPTWLSPTVTSSTKKPKSNLSSWMAKDLKFAKPKSPRIRRKATSPENGSCPTPLRKEPRNPPPT
jgi:hypothetical protein